MFSPKVNENSLIFLCAGGLFLSFLRNFWLPLYTSKAVPNDSGQPILAVIMQAPSELCGVRSEVFLYHQRDLEDYRVVEFAQVEPGQLLDLVQAVNQRVAVYEQLSGGLGHVQAVLEELLDSEQGLVIEGLNGVLLENFLEEGLAQSGREVVDKSCDTEVVVAYDVLVGVEYLSYLEGCLSLLEGACEVLNADYRCRRSPL